MRNWNCSWGPGAICLCVIASAIIFGSAAGAAPNVAAAQGGLRIAIIESSSQPELQALYHPARAGFIDEMTRSGFREGDGIRFDGYRLGQGSNSDRRTLEKITSARPNLIFALGTEAAALAARSLDDGASGHPAIPVVYAMVFEPPPGNSPNIVGVTLNIPAAKQFETLQSVDPQVHRIGVVYDPTSKTSSRIVEQARHELDDDQAQRHSGLTLVVETAGGPEASGEALNRLLPRVDALWMTPDAISASINNLQWCLRHRIPVIGLSDLYVQYGALIALTPNYADIGRQAADLAVKILRGAAPADLSTAGEACEPRQMELWVNRAAAAQLGVQIAPEIEATADHVVNSLQKPPGTPE